jgi:hypothetical protein
MDFSEIKIYCKELDVDGTVPEMLDKCYRYSDKYSDDALQFIADKAKEYGFDNRIPLLLLSQRTNVYEGRLPYEQMKLDRLRGGKISHSETASYGEVEIREEDDLVLVSIIGMDDCGSFTAASAVTVNEFMDGDESYLERLVASILFYCKQYEEEEMPQYE